MIQRHNRKGMSEMIGQLNLEPVNIRRTMYDSQYSQFTINGHLALPIGNLQLVLRHTRHLNSKAFDTIHTSKDWYKYSFFLRTVKYYNALPDKIATIISIKEPQKLKIAFTLTYFT